MLAERRISFGLVGVSIGILGVAVSLGGRAIIQQGDQSINMYPVVGVIIALGGVIASYMAATETDFSWKPKKE
jgi:hypothetical protein